MKVFLPCKSSVSGFEAELKTYLEGLNVNGYALMGFSVRSPKDNAVLEADALIFVEPGKIVCVEAKGYGGKWTGSVNTEWRSNDLLIKSTQSNPFKQVQRYGYIVKDILSEVYPEVEDFWVINVVVAKDGAELNIEGTVTNRFSQNAAMLVCNLSSLGYLINGIQVRRALKREVERIGLFEIASKVVGVSSEELRALESVKAKPKANLNPSDGKVPLTPLPSNNLRRKIPIPLFIGMAIVVAGVLLIPAMSFNRPEIADENSIPNENSMLNCGELEKLEEGNCYRDLARSTLVIGILSSPDRYQPLADYLRIELGGDVMNVIVEGDSNLLYQDAKNQIAQQNWDLVFAYSPMNSMAAHDNNYQWIARMFPDFPAFYQSVLYVRADSPINSIADLNSSHTIALNNFGSASGFYRPIYDLYGKTLRVVMQRGGGQVKELVLSGGADIGAGPLTVAENDPELKIIHVSTDIPGSGLYLSPRISPSDRERLTQILLSAPDEIRDQREGANYGEGVEPNWQEFRRISLRVEELIQCRTFQEDPVPLFCPEDPPQLSIEGSTGTIKGFQFVDADTVRLNFFDAENQMHHLIAPVTMLSGVPNGQTPATLNNKTVILSNDLVFENSANGVPTASLESANQIVVQVTN